MFALAVLCVYDLIELGILLNIRNLISDKTAWGQLIDPTYTS